MVESVKARMRRLTRRSPGEVRRTVNADARRTPPGAVNEDAARQAWFSRIKRLREAERSDAAGPSSTTA